MELNHILKGAGSKAPGVKPVMFFAPEDWFDVIGEPSTTEDGTGSLSIITTNHTFQAGSPAKGFIKIELAQNTAEVNIEEVGEPENEAVNVTGTGYHPGLHTLLLSYFGKPFNGIVLMQDLDCSNVRYYQIGASCSMARKEGWKFGTGKAGGEGKKGFDLKFASYQAAALIYTGAVTTSEQPVVS